jgi:hypothetical protein
VPFELGWELKRYNRNRPPPGERDHADKEAEDLSLHTDES